jgi:hypothetical protein
MVLTNIELYEALKRDLSEDSARMIAEVVPPASDLATKTDISELKGYLERRFAESDRRVTRSMMRMIVVFVGPLYAALTAEVVKLILK